MVVSVKDSLKLVGISIITFCAVFVCTMFLNYNIDIEAIADTITTAEAQTMYDALHSTGIVVCWLCGLCLLLTSVVMLIFYIKHFVDTHCTELGILKAMGYSKFAIAKHFWVFGLSVLVGAALGFGGAWIFMPRFYELQNEGEVMLDVAMNFHPVLLLCFVVLPTVLFSALACGYAYWQLKIPAIHLLKESKPTKSAKKDKPIKPAKQSSKERNFLLEMTLNTLKSRKTLVFFVVFSAFCFSSLVQMAYSMKDLSTEEMGAMMFVIGVVLAFTTLLISVQSVVDGNKKSIALMKVLGYTERQCSTAILGGYRPFAYLGFAVGTVYQYALLRIMVDIVFKGVDGVPPYNFEWIAMLVTLAVFVITYEAIMFVFSRKIGKVSVKKIMME